MSKLKQIWNWLMTLPKIVTTSAPEPVPVSTGWSKMICHLAWQPGWAKGAVVKKGWGLGNQGNTPTDKGYGVHFHCQEVVWQAQYIHDFYRSNVYPHSLTNPQWWVDIIKSTHGLVQTLGYMEYDNEYYYEDKKHMGIDIAGGSGWGFEIAAPFDLVVVDTGYDENFGYYIIFQEVIEWAYPCPTCGRY